MDCFIFLLIVLLPHTAWFFRQFESDESAILIKAFSFSVSDLVSWIAAISFESAIAVFTHKLSTHISNIPNRGKPLQKFSKRYLNAYSLGLFIAWIISTTANYAHAVEYGRSIKLFTQWGISLHWSALFSGAILPTCSFLFARILSDVSEDELHEQDELTKVKREQSATKRELTRVQSQLTKTAGLFSDSKKVKVETILALWPDIPKNAVASMAGCSPAYVTRITGTPKSPQVDRDQSKAKTDGMV